MSKKNNQEMGTINLGGVKLTKVRDLMFTVEEEGKTKKITFDEFFDRQVEKVMKESK